MDLSQLIACGVAPTQARAFIGPINAHCPRFLINTRSRMAAFLAEGMWESANFAKLEESFFYREPASLVKTFSRAFRSSIDAVPYVMGKDIKGLANKVYAGVAGNGDEASGDGWKFRGRGCGITGRGNYERLGSMVARDWLSNPDDVATPDGAILSFCAYWTWRQLNQPADGSDIDAVTRKINPAMFGAAQRRQLFAECSSALIHWEV